MKSLIINEVAQWVKEGYVPGRVSQDTPVHVGSDIPFVSIRAYFAHEFGDKELDALVDEAKAMFPTAASVELKYDYELNEEGEPVDAWPRVNLTFSSQDEAEKALRAVA